MMKQFHIQIPLSYKDSFDLLCKSGNDIISWKTNSTDLKNGYIEWKQSMWSLTGTTGITAQVKESKEKETEVTITVNKPFQLMDPVKLCDKVFRKLDVTWRRNLIDFESHPS